MYENEVKSFCKLLNVSDLEELRPLWAASCPSNMSKNELKFLSVTLMKAIKKLHLRSKAQKLNLINALPYQLKYGNKKSPFFDSGYHGVKCTNLKNTRKFYFMVTDGCMGLEDMSCADATIDGQRISLVHSNRRFGDCRMHEEDEQKNVNLVSEILYKKFLGD